MRARTVNFEKNGDPMKTMKIGSHREMTDQQLIDAVFDNIWYDDLETDPKFAKEEPLIFKDDVYNWILNIATQDENTEETRTMSPDEITSDDYRMFYDQIHEDDEPEEIDYEEILDDIDWED